MDDLRKRNFYLPLLGTQEYVERKQQFPKWQEIADDVNRASDEINASLSAVKTGTQFKDKWHNLLSMYKKAKDSCTETGKDRRKMKAFQQFEQMDIFMVDKREIAMSFVVNLSKISVPVKSPTDISKDSSVGSPTIATVSYNLDKPSCSDVQFQETDEPPERPQKKECRKRESNLLKQREKVGKMTEVADGLTFLKNIAKF